MSEREENRLIYRAHLLAQFVHTGQVDKSGNPYMRHVSRVADSMHDPVDKIVAYLHDTIEDGPHGIATVIAATFGGEVASAVEAMSHRPHEAAEDYYARVRENERAVRVKHADLTDNSDRRRLALLATVDAETADRLAAKYEKAKRLLAQR